MVLKDILQCTRTSGTVVHSLVSVEQDESALATGEEATDTAAVEEETDGFLHVSLSHPLPLRRDLADRFTRELRPLLPKGGFRVSFAPKVCVYYNSLARGTADSSPAPSVVAAASPQPETASTRPSAQSIAPSRSLTPTTEDGLRSEGVKDGGKGFLALRVGAGTRDLLGLLTAVEGLVERYHLPKYHSEPEFHASFAWALAGSVDKDGLREQEPFPPSLLEQLETINEHLLKAQPREGFWVDEVCVRIAKDITRIPL